MLDCLNIPGLLTLAQRVTEKLVKQTKIVYGGGETKVHIVPLYHEPRFSPSNALAPDVTKITGNARQIQPKIS
jgi:hypothetical protein